VRAAGRLGPASRPPSWQTAGKLWREGGKEAGRGTREGLPLWFHSSKGIGDSNSYGSAPSGHSRTTERVTQSSDCWNRSSDKPSLAILLFFMVLNRGLLHMEGQTLKIIFHPSKRKSDEK